MKHLYWYLFAGTRGGMTRIKIVHEIEHEPINANRLAEKLQLDYKTVRHHLKVLMKNRLIIAEGYYGANYFVAPEFNKLVFSEIWEKVGKNHG